MSKLTKKDISEFGPFTDILNAAKRTLIILFSRMPKLTGEDVGRPNSRVLVELRDESLKHLTHEYHRRVFEAAWNIAIIKYEKDGVYQRYIDYVLEEWQKKPWEFSKKIEHIFWRHEVE